ncbi:MAG: exodeoxyribonuclease VII small subunit [Desulfonatronovibrionaceae bacterium]
MAEKKPSFEENLRELEDIVRKLEEGELPLEQGVELFKKGMALSRSCREQLEKARYEVRILSEELDAGEQQEEENDRE